MLVHAVFALLILTVLPFSSSASASLDSLSEWAKNYAKEHGEEIAAASKANASARHDWAHHIAERHTPLGLALLQMDSPCSDTHDVSKDKCLSKGADCMWVQKDNGNDCLPCEFGGVDIPCAPVDSIFAGGQVKECRMNCAHQQIATKIGVCVDTGGEVSVSTCFAKSENIVSQEKCMWTGYVDKNGKGKSLCGPCVVGGIGTIPCYNFGDIGPEGPGSTAVGCASMCDTGATEYGIPCGGHPVFPQPAVTPCRPVPPPPLPPKGTMPLEVMKVHTSETAPNYFAVAVDKPYGMKQWTDAAELAARTAGWLPGTNLPPDAAVVIYGWPPLEGPTLPPTLKVMYGPAPPGIPGVPPPGYGEGTAPPAANVEAAMAQAGLLQVSETTERETSQEVDSHVQGVASPVLAQPHNHAWDGAPKVNSSQASGQEVPLLRGGRPRNLPL